MVVVKNEGNIQRVLFEVFQSRGATYFLDTCHTTVQTQQHTSYFLSMRKTVWILGI